ncbi:MAG: sigma-54-dependent Fis family transcriptional regulator [Deltaproteobacteria bacterium]|nr:sigma-54-dependent Fis family transcriptional regulator [Deltaproteobacteria bacterium]
MSHRVLIAEDDEASRFLIEQYCRGEAFHLTTARDGIEAVRLFNAAPFDIVVTDVRLPGLTGEELLEYVRQSRPSTLVIVITGFGSIDGAVHFLQRGAFDYITKPFTKQVFLHRLALAARNLELVSEVDRLRRLQPTPSLGRILTSDAKLVQLLSRLPSIAKTDASVLFYGESGTGKELFARAAHELSPRGQMPFVSVSCGALPETLIESEMFGHVRGAFTDAHTDRHGLIEEAEGGTLFLDEIGEVPLAVQVKLLRFLQEREFKPVGASEIKRANVRVVSATHRDLEQEVARGRFREDLYYRLNVVPIMLPPLRERAGDVPLLANHYLRRFAAEFGRRADSFSPETVELMAAYAWPGNVRELINRIQRMVVVSDEVVISPSTWYRSGTGLDGTSDADDTSLGFTDAKRRVIERFESAYLGDCLRRARGNVAQAARMARMDRKNFWMLMKRYRIDAGEYRESEVN